MEIYFKIDLELLGDNYDFVSLKDYYLDGVFNLHGGVLSDTVFVKVPRYGYSCKRIIEVLNNMGKNVIIVVAGFLDNLELDRCFEINQTPCIPLVENLKSFYNIQMMSKNSYVDFPVIGTKDLTQTYKMNKEDLIRHIKGHRAFQGCYIGGYSEEKIFDSDFKNISTKYFMVKNKKDSDSDFLIQLYDEIDNIYKSNMLF